MHSLEIDLTGFLPGSTLWWARYVPDMTYNVFGGMLNLAQFNSIHNQSHT